jgi:hypothetical protein
LVIATGYTAAIELEWFLDSGHEAEERISGYEYPLAYLLNGDISLVDENIDIPLGKPEKGGCLASGDQRWVLAPGDG